MKTILRWTATPFAAIIGSLTAYLIISLWVGVNNTGYELYTGSGPVSITKLALGIAAQAVAGAAFVFCGASTAPNHKKTCATVLATIMCVVALSSIVLHNTFYGFSILQLIHCIATACGAISVCCNSDNIFSD